MVSPKKQETKMSEFTLDDGRKAEKLEISPDSLTKVIELYVEPKASKRLSQRVIERFCVCERETQTVNEETGEVVDRVVENLCSGPQASVQKVVESSPMRAAVEKKVAMEFDTKFYVFGAIILAQMAALAYVVFFM
jgi:hypothetical protein